MNDSIKYWIEYWEDLFSGIESDRFAFKMMNPRIVLKELEEEIEFNKLANKNNRDFLYSKINHYFEHDLPSQKCLIPLYKLIRGEFQNPRHTYLSQLCKNALKIFDRLEYFNSCISCLEELLLSNSPSENNKENIHFVTQDIIVELTVMGHTKIFIQGIPKILFSEYQMINGRIITGFPTEIPFPKQKNDSKSLSKYNDAVKLFMEKLTDKKRIQAIKNIVKQKKQKLTYIFQVKGLRGDVDFKIDQVLFYSPRIRKLVSDSDYWSEEFFHSKKNVFLNAAVTIEIHEVDAGFSQARELVSKALNVLRFYWRCKIPYEISLSYLVLDGKGRPVSVRSTRDDDTSDHWIWHKSFDIKDDLLSTDTKEFEQLKGLLKTNSTSRIERKILSSLHWFRKADEAEPQTDSLLWYWICIENLFTKEFGNVSNWLLESKMREKPFEISLEILPRKRTISLAYHIGWNVYNKVNSVVSKIMRLPNDSLKLPQSLIEKANLSRAHGKKINLSNFIKALPEIKKYIKGELLLDQINDVSMFYSEKEYTVKVLNEEIKDAKSEVVMLYRMRNKIVHNANYDNFLLPYFISSANQFSGDLLNRVLELHYKEGILRLEEIMLRIFSEYDILRAKLNEQGPSCLFRKDIF